MLFDLLGEVQQVEVLAHLGDHVVLTPNVGEPGLDLARLEHLDSADEEDAEEDDQVEHPVEGGHQQGEGERQAHDRVDEQVGEDPSGGLGNGLEVGDPPLPRADEGHHGQEQHPLDHAAQAVAQPRVHPRQQPVPPAEQALTDEVLPAGAALGDQDRHLVEHFQPEERNQPPLGPELVPDSVAERVQRDLLTFVHRGQGEDDTDDDQEPQPVEQHHLAPRFTLHRRRYRHRSRWWGRRWARDRSGHRSTFHDVTIWEISCRLSSKHFPEQPTIIVYMRLRDWSKAVTMS